MKSALIRVGPWLRRSVLVCVGLWLCWLSVAAAERPMRVGFVGRVVPIKDVITLIRAIGLARYQVELEVWIIGPEDEDPVYAKRCKTLVKMLKLEDTVKFLGPRRVSEIYPELDVVVLLHLVEVARDFDDLADLFARGIGTEHRHVRIALLVNLRVHSMKTVRNDQERRLAEGIELVHAPVIRRQHVDDVLEALLVGRGARHQVQQVM